MNLEVLIEGILFYRAEPILKTELARLAGMPQPEIDLALARLRENLTGRGIVLVETETEVELMTAPELADTLHELRKEELKRDIGKAGAETLAIILYRGPLSRPEIDFIRGVNSTFVLRNLLMRGLIERVQSPEDQRSYRYAATPTLLAHLGVSRKTDLPQYAEIMDELDRYEREYRAEENEYASEEPVTEQT